MRVASQILENALGSAEGGFDVNYPFDFGGFLTQELERGRLCQRLEFAEEAKLSFAERLS